MDNSTLSSALSVFTSEFEMVSGGTHSLSPPGDLAILSDLIPLMKYIDYLGLHS